MRRFGPLLMLLAAGAAWGLTLPLVRIAASTGHQPLGLVLWQKVIMAGLLLVLVRAMGLPLPVAWRHLGLFVTVAVFGAILPGYFTFLTAAELPAGVRAIIISIVPMFVLPLALLLGFERPSVRRAAGVALGALAIAAISLPGTGSAQIGLGVILLALITPLSYAVEANYLAWRGSGGLHPFQLLLGASVVGIALTWPLARAAGQTVDLGIRWGGAEWAILGAGLLNALGYSGYVWLVGKGGSVFSSQIAYLVTGFGVFWSMLLLGESYGAGVWAAFGLMLAGIALVQPKPAPSETA